jgi:chromate reductase
MGIECQLLTMEQLPRDFAFSYLADPKPDEFTEIMDKYMRPVDKFIAVVPEYQSTFPGVFKLFLDAIRQTELAGKKVALVGVSTGRAGNLRGLDHLTAAFHYLNVHVFPNKLPISGIQNLVNSEYKLTDEGTILAMKKQLEGFLNY